MVAAFAGRAPKAATPALAHAVSFASDHRSTAAREPAIPYALQQERRAVPSRWIFGRSLDLMPNSDAQSWNARLACP
jgi:hypothetical protein